MICYGCGGLLGVDVAWDDYDNHVHSGCLAKLEQNWHEHADYARDLADTLAKERSEREQLRRRSR
jgi:hypothetical protein